MTESVARSGVSQLRGVIVRYRVTRESKNVRQIMTDARIVALSFSVSTIDESDSRLTVKRVIKKDRTSSGAFFEANQPHHLNWGLPVSGENSPDGLGSHLANDRNDRPGETMVSRAIGRRGPER